MFDDRWAALEQREISRRAQRAGPGAAAEPGSRPRPDLKAGIDLLPQIKHIVVLMMENHSYDNYLGTLAGRGEGLAPGPDGAAAAANPRRDGTPVRAHHFGSTTQVERVPTHALTRRDAAAESPLEALDLDGPPAFLKPPDLPAPSLPWHFEG
jgi:phospholipase C